MNHAVEPIESMIGTMVNHPISDHVWRKLIKDFNAPLDHVNHINTIFNLEIAYKNGLSQGTELVTKWAYRLSQQDNAVVDGFMNLVIKVIQDMIDQVKNSQGYIEGFNKVDLQSLMPLKQKNIPSGDIYGANYEGCRFISFDLSEAAFQAFHYWDEHWNSTGTILPTGVNTYKEWVEYTVKRVTMDEVDSFISEWLVEYICDSKQLRQVMFGNTNPKRIQHVEKYMVQELVEVIESSSDGEILPIKLNNDEAIYQYSPELVKIVDALYNSTKNNWHINEFTLSSKTLIQSVQMSTGVVEYTGPKVFIKEKKELGPNGFELTKPSFKCLPSKLALGFEILYKQSLGTLPDTSGVFEAIHFFNEPRVVDGILTWISNPKTIWSIR